MGYNCFGGLGLVEKAVYFLNSKKFKKRRVESRDNICVIENHLIDRNHSCMYLAKSHLFTA